MLPSVQAIHEAQATRPLNADGRPLLFTLSITLSIRQLLTHTNSIPGSYWYFVYPNVTTQDVLFSLPHFTALYFHVFETGKCQHKKAYDTAVLQFTNMIKNCLATHTGGLLYHGYDPTRTYPIWGNLNRRGHSQSIWGRAMGWTVTGLLLTLDVIPPNDPHSVQLREMFSTLMRAIHVAQDKETGAWWQVMDYPRRRGNYLESSATGMFAHAMARGARLGYLPRDPYVNASRKAYEWLHENAVVELEDGLLGYNRTVDLCSINSTTAFDVSCPLFSWFNERVTDFLVLQYYVSRPLKPDSLLGEVGAILTDVELMLLEGEKDGTLNCTAPAHPYLGR